jgi:anthranilate phosphoribosyltransferase
MLRKAVETLMHHENLDQAMCEHAFNALLDPTSNPLQIAAFLVLLRAKPETAEELATIVSLLRSKMVKVNTHHKVLDIVGTGGDGANTVNISTGSAILAASCGVKVAKHGNRAVSSLAGSADVLEALGVKIDLSPEKISESIDKIGIGFCFSPNFHGALKALRTLRKELNIPTTLNILGPLLNPAEATYYVLGVYDATLQQTIAGALKQTGCEKAIVVHGSGLDEISSLGPAEVIEVMSNAMRQSVIDPAEFGITRCSLADLKGGDAAYNAMLLRDTFGGKKGAIADTLILNAAVALWLYGLQPSIKEAILHAKENLQNGAAATLLNNWIEFSHV